MIPDILMSLLSKCDNSTLQKIIEKKTASQNFSSNDIDTINHILKFINIYKEVWMFALKHNNCTSQNSTSNGLQPGIYLQAFSDGIEEVIKEFHLFVLELEKKFNKKPDHSLMFVKTELDRYKSLFQFLQSLINGIRVQKLHGCNILQHLENNLLHGDQKIVQAISKIQKEVYAVFIRHLCQWMIYGKIVDQFNEFFIHHVENVKPIKDSIHSTATFTSSESTNSGELWHFEINYDLFPNYFSRKWAEKVLFVGQTVAMFNSDPREMIKNKLWSSDSSEVLSFDKEVSRKKQSIWGNQEYLYYRKFHELQMKEECLEVEHFDQMVDEIKLCVSEHLSDIAVNEAGLIKTLKVIKDFYLLGRGELFYEFIKEISINYTKPVNEATVRDINRAFQVAGSSVNISDDIDSFVFQLNKEVDNFNYENRGFINHITLKYKVHWPLHLIFTPVILERYNELFRFLLKIKKTQYNLHMIWNHQRATKVERNSKLLQFRNKLMFLFDNLQYYLQVDVLESQFSIMLEKIQASMDFEEIQRAHSMFQANILSLCFLLETTEQSRSDSQIAENPVLTSLHKIILLVENFSMFIFSCSNPLSECDQDTFSNFEPLFDLEVASLLKKVAQMKVGSSSVPLSQFLLRLDFNHWFTKNIK